ncbi:MAG: hypothetical protein PHE79_04850 [Eubacteriales bacterium]|nr:hypothetical protein [Eubacteriales bacterium]
MNDLMELPTCPHGEHGQMELRPIEHQTPEQKYCGAWYDCKYPGCSCSVLIMSPELCKLHGNKRCWGRMYDKPNGRKL